MPREGVIHDYVSWAVGETFADPLFHLACILPVVAYEATTLGWGGPWEIPKRGSQGAFQSFLIGQAASAKSTCLRMARAFHEDVLKRTRGALWDESKRPWIGADGTIPGILEASYDRFERDLGITPAILFHEEASSILEKGGATIDCLMQLFDPVDRVERQLREYRATKAAGGRAPACIEKPAIGAVFCATMNSAGRVLTQDHFEGGLASRVLWIRGEVDLSRFWNSRPNPEGRRGVVERWAHHGPRLAGRRLGAGVRVVRQAEAHKELLMPLFEEMAEATRREDSARGSVFMRGMGMAETIAALYALSRGHATTSAGDLQAAIKLVQRSLTATGFLQQTAGDDPVFKCFERALRYIKRAGPQGLTRAALNRNHLRVSGGVLDQVVGLLEESGEIFISKSRTGKRGRPTQLFLDADLVSEQDNVISFRKPPEEADVSERDDGGSGPSDLE